MSPDLEGADIVRATADRDFAIAAALQAESWVAMKPPEQRQFYNHLCEKWWAIARHEDNFLKFMMETK